jgi:hypothetical protein
VLTSVSLVITRWEFGGNMIDTETRFPSRIVDRREHFAIMP